MSCERKTIVSTRVCRVETKESMTTFIFEDDHRCLQTRMDLKLLPVLGDNGRIEQDGIEAAKQLIVDLNPLDAEVIGDWMKCSR